jgi:hypothetical protein
MKDYEDRTIYSFTELRQGAIVFASGVSEPVLLDPEFRAIWNAIDARKVE